MAEVQSQSSVFKQYMQSHPEALQALFRVVTTFYVDPLKVSEIHE